MALKIDLNGSIDLESFIDNWENLQIIDVRSQSEWDEGHLKNAIHIPLAELPLRLDEIEPNRQTAFICAKGLRAAMAWKIFKQENPHSLTSGYVVTSIDYSAANAPVFHILDENWHKDIIAHIAHRQ